MYRLFVAIDLPEDVRAEIRDLQRVIPGVKWVDMAQFHLTLRFIGDADEALFDRIRDELSGIKSPPFSLSLRGVGYFPPKRDPRVLWVGIDRSETLFGLRNLVEKALVRSGIEPEGRSFSPHITIARIKGAKVSPLSALLRDHERFAVQPFPVSEFILYSSTLRPQGAIHRKEAVYPLSGGPGNVSDDDAGAA
ncbi:MAG TPA: RNA 2',3'-cyclic phosphodiesterase [Geobacteraceae bacterium]|nr:RNA 2',3'-cyclic phosphodiesterase [Geobacteraceae bacterium]